MQKPRSEVEIRFPQEGQARPELQRGIYLDSNFAWRFPLLPSQQPCEVVAFFHPRVTAPHFRPRTPTLEPAYCRSTPSSISQHPRSRADASDRHCLLNCSATRSTIADRLCASRFVRVKRSAVREAATLDCDPDRRAIWEGRHFPWCGCNNMR